MKTITLIIALLIVVISVHAQEAGQVSLRVGLEAGLPSGTFSDYSNTGFGGMASLVLNKIAPDFRLSLTSGYLSFGGKDFARTSSSTTNINTGIIPILVGARYYFVPGTTEFYGEMKGGLYLMSTSSTTTGNGFTGSGSSSGSSVGISPSVGVEFKAGEKTMIDAHVSYTNIFSTSSFTPGDNTGWIGIGAGVSFDLQ